MAPPETLFKMVNVCPSDDVVPTVTTRLLPVIVTAPVARDLVMSGARGGAVDINLKIGDGRQRERACGKNRRWYYRRSQVQGFLLH